MRTFVTSLIIIIVTKNIFSQSLLSLMHTECEIETERTFIMIKPDGVQRELIGEIIHRFERKGFKLVALKIVWADEKILSNHYEELSKETFFPDLIKYITSGPVCPMVWEGLNVVKAGRMLLGDSDPNKSLPGTIRGDYSTGSHNTGRNIIHAADSVQSVKREIALWFKAEDIINWQSNNDKLDQQKN